MKPPGAPGHGGGKSMIRVQRTGWKVVHGARAHSAHNVDAWALICPECGDDDGPMDERSEAGRRLCGTYPSKGAAHAALEEHIGVIRARRP